MPRTEFTAKTMDAALKRADGKCEAHLIWGLLWKRAENNELTPGCNSQLGAGNTYFEHIICCELGGDNSLENCTVLCRTHWRLKTSNYDQPKISQAKRRERNHFGIRKPKRPMAGSRASGWRHRMDGTWERR